MQTFKAYAITAWVIAMIMLGNLIAERQRRTRRATAQRILGHAKHYLHQMTGHQGLSCKEVALWDAIDIITQVTIKIEEAL